MIDVNESITLEVEATPTGLPNIVRNPDGELGSWYWSTPLANSDVETTTAGLRLTTQVAQNAYTVSELMPAVAGQYYAARFNLSAITTGCTVSARLDFWDLNQDTILGSVTSAGLGAGTNHIGAPKAPTNAYFVSLTLTLTKTSGTPAAGSTFTFNNVMVTHASTAAAVATFDYVPPITWIDINGSSAERTVTRDELEVGTLGVTVYDLALDPAHYDVLTKGKAIRLSYEGQHMYTGTISNVSASYDMRKSGKYSTPITITADDAVSILGNNAEPRVVATINDLPELLEGKGVPWRVNGWTGQATNAKVIAYNDNASMLDAVGLVRDTNSGYAWVDPSGVLNIYDIESMPESATPNLNGDFDTNVTGWTGSGATLARDTTNVFSGTGAMRVTATSAGTVYARTPTGINGFRVGASQPFTLHFAARSATPRQIACTLKYYNLSGVNIGQQTFYPTEATTYKEFTTEGLTGAHGTVYCSIEIAIPGAAVGEVHYIDHVSLVMATPREFSDAPGSELSYSDLPMAYNSDALINQVNVSYLRYNIGDGSSQLVNYGPYVDPVSFSQYGASSRTFTICLPVEDEAAIAAFAARVLQSNSAPQMTVGSMTIPVKTAAQAAAVANIDLYDVVTVTNKDRFNKTPVRVTGITHTITSQSWTTTLTFGGTESVASPSSIPAPPLKSAVELAAFTQAGTVTLTPTGTGNRYATTTITFPKAYQSPPAIVLGVNGVATASVGVTYENPTSTNFVIRLWRNDTSVATQVSWLAHGV